MKKKVFIATILLSIVLQAQNQNASNKECYVGSSAFMLMNLILINDPEPPRFYMLDIGYRITPKNVVSLEAITWNYYEPIGMSGKEKSDGPNFPGRVEAYGLGLTYKRFIWKQAFAKIHATAFHQNFLDESEEKIRSGFQLFNTLRLGYQFRIFKNKFFIEPSLAVTNWPINTNLPDAFQDLEDGYDKFDFEPGLHFGFNF